MSSKTRASVVKVNQVLKFGELQCCKHKLCRQAQESHRELSSWVPASVNVSVASQWRSVEWSQVELRSVELRYDS